jgi:hypothetical protein
VPSKTNSDKIDEVIKEVAILNERLGSVRKDIERIDKAIEESQRKQWMLMLALLGAILTLAVNLLILVSKR